MKYSWLLATLVVFSLSIAMPEASAQGRLSLSERVAKLEADAAKDNNQASIDLLNRLNELQAEVQTLRGMVEQQAFQLEELKNRNRDLYADLDSRLARLEGNPAAVSPPPVVPALADGQTQDLSVPPPQPPADPNQLAMEPISRPSSPPPVTDTLPVAPSQTAPAVDPLATPTPTAPVAPPPSNSAVGTTMIPQAGEQQAYDAAFAALREGRYAESARRFSSFLEQFPNGDLADNATYWLGESYYVTQNYRIALDTFRALLNQFPDSAKAPDAALKVGYCHYELREWPEAERQLNDVMARYPNTVVARLAQSRLNALRLEGRRP
ncbi:tol-pal system protein YbgF [Ahniella affigens]|uniref:Cell division coordinator CpoB n=1 Tax=Ahniella affigens TaxID=2021234 RepID=A0A2P1PYA7_9GAMM|nr:tol-pal system protein YbgF [Ahniella affigens]AVP99810.1 tol-pal system protein YbgF [Ahniella affigens]